MSTHLNGYLSLFDLTVHAQHIDAAQQAIVISLL